MNPEEAKKQLMDEAKMHLNLLFRIPLGCSNSAVDRIVDCLVGATAIEVSLIMQQAMKEAKDAMSLVQRN